MTRHQPTEIAAFATLPEARIDTSDIPEQRDWSGARRGVFYRPLKQRLTVRIDADVVAWFKTHASERGGYRTSMNQAPREYV